MVKLSVIVPTYNEVSNIENLIRSITNIDGCEKEIFLVDGGSTDGTQQRIVEINARDARVQLVENKARYVSQGFNKAFQLAQGQFISLVGAHAEYPQNYFSTCIAHIEQGECEVAGGFLRHKGQGIVGQAIAHCMASHFGVGNTEFRTIRKKMYVDSVAFAVYDRRIFEQVGLLDEDLVRNQDDEFHYRLNQAGVRILMLPELEPAYFVRNSLRQLFDQYRQYGFYKPLVFKKVRQSIRLRHLIPPGFVLYLLSMPIAWLWPLWACPLAIYVLTDLVFSLSAALSWRSKLAALLAYPCLHIAYGLGFLHGLWHWNIKN